MPRKSVSRLTDWLDMTLCNNVDWVIELKLIRKVMLSMRDNSKEMTMKYIYIYIFPQENRVYYHF